MYKFIDTTEVSESVVLPSEALQINGEYIENLIDGYRTLSVSGREALSPELSYYETGVRDGSVLQSKRYPKRTIIVCYQLVAESSEAFREAYNKLGKILNVENAQLIFNDERDKFYTGTPSMIGEVEPGRNAVIGEIEILCTDPFKYSVGEYEVEADADSAFFIDYNGTYKSYPTLVAEFYKENEVSEDGESNVALTGNGDCGYVAFFDDNQQIIQMGDPEEVDKVDILPDQQTMMNNLLKTDLAWGTGAQSLWTVNSGINIPPTPHPIQMGSVGMKVSGEKDSTFYGTHYLAATNYGSAQNRWHGPVITRMIGADQAGDVGATNFLVSFHHKMSIGNYKSAVGEYGRFAVYLMDDNNNVVMGVDICKYRTGKKAVMHFYIEDEFVKWFDIDLSYNNKYLGHGSVTSWMRKTGSEFCFNMVGHRESFLRADLADRIATKVVVSFDQYSNKSPLTHNGLFWLKLVKHDCDTWADVPNKFGANDVLEADCKNGEILLNGALAPELGALGNDWESFCLMPGANSIGASCSSWVKEGCEPTFKVRYREVFL